jgi:hypothetical protein
MGLTGNFRANTMCKKCAKSTEENKEAQPVKNARNVIKYETKCTKYEKKGTKREHNIRM